MELTTFGALLGFAMQFEATAEAFYAQAAAAGPGDHLARFCATLRSGDTALLKLRSAEQRATSLRSTSGEARAQAQKNLRTLERIRREQVNEMLLESLEGMKADDYELEAAPAEAALPHIAGQLEARIERFYRDAIGHISIPEVARSFSRLADLHARQREVWRQLLISRDS